MPGWLAAVAQTRRFHGHTIEEVYTWRIWIKPKPAANASTLAASKPATDSAAARFTEVIPDILTTALHRKRGKKLRAQNDQL